MKRLTLAFASLLAVTAAASDVAVGQPGPPPMGGPPHPPGGGPARPPMHGLARPPTGGPPRTAMHGVPRQPVGGPPRTAIHGLPRQTMGGVPARRRSPTRSPDRRRSIRSCGIRACGGVWECCRLRQRHWRPGEHRRQCRSQP